MTHMLLKDAHANFNVLCKCKFQCMMQMLLKIEMWSYLVMQMLLKMKMQVSIVGFWSCSRRTKYNQNYQSSAAECNIKYRKPSAWLTWRVSIESIIINSHAFNHELFTHTSWWIPNSKKITFLDLTHQARL